MDASDPRRQGLAAAKAVLDGATSRAPSPARPAHAPQTSNAEAAAATAVPSNDDDHERLVRRLAELEDEVSRLRAALEAIAEATRSVDSDG